MLLSIKQVYALARSVGLDHDHAVTATAIAKAESGLDADILGDVSLENSTWGPSVGLWQVRSLRAQYGTGGVRDASHLTNPAFNARAMLAISSGGSSWSPWSTYTNGAYRAHLATVSKAVGNGSKYDQGSAPAGTTATDASHSWILGPDPGDLIDGGEWVGKELGKGAGAVGKHDAKVIGKGIVGLWDVDTVRKIVLTGAVVIGGVALVLVGTAATARGED